MFVVIKASCSTYNMVSNVLSSSRNLDLSKFCIGQKDEMQHPPIYDLYAVINHYGGMIGGHYTAYARLPSDKNSQRSDVGESAVNEVYSHFIQLLVGLASVPSCLFSVALLYNPVSNLSSLPPPSSLKQAGVCLMTAL